MTILLGFAAVNTANNLLYLVVSALLSFMGLSGLFGKRNLSKVDVDIELPDEIYANRPVPVKIRLRNNKRLLSGFLLRVVIGDTEVLFPFVDVRDETSKYLTFSFEKRGKSRVQNIHVCSVFPFNFFVRCRKIEKDVEFIVYPEPKKYELLGFFERQRKSHGEKPSDRIGYDSETISIRDYIQGDPLKYISWKATARTGELKTKELSSHAYQPVIIDLNEISARSEEDKISSVTYAVLNFLKKNVPVGLRIGRKLYKPGLSGAHKASILKELALYGTEE